MFDQPTTDNQQSAPPTNSGAGTNLGSGHQNRSALSNADSGGGAPSPLSLTQQPSRVNLGFQNAEVKTNQNEISFGQPAANLPVFNQDGQVEDILEDSDHNTKPPQLQPISSSAPEDDLASINQEMIDQGLIQDNKKNSFSVEESLSKNKTLFIVGIVGVIVIVLGVAGWIIYKKFYAPTSSDKPPTEDPAQSDVPAQTDVPNQLDIPTQPSVIEPDLPLIPNEKDSDNDGLTDKDEIKFGTNPNKIDTDSDGLSDYDEINVFKTDPTQADTDRDGYFDGEEIANGFNPLGAGSLRSISKDTTEWLSYKNTELGLQFKYPQEFTTPNLETIELMGNKSYQINFSADDGMGNPNITINVDLLQPQVFHPDKLYEISEDNNNQLIISGVQEKNEGDEHVQFFVTQSFQAQNNHTYLIYFDAQEGYEDYTVLFDYILSTFMFP